MKIWDKIKLACSVKVAQPAVNRLSEGASPSEPARKFLKFNTFAWLNFSKNYAQYADNRRMMKCLDKHFNCKTKSYLIVSDDGKDLRWQINGQLGNQLVMLETLIAQIHKGIAASRNRN